MSKFFLSLYLCVALWVAFPLFTEEKDIKEVSVAEKIQSEKLGFQKRWNDFTKDHKEFPLWRSEWTEEELQIRFDEMKKERRSVYFDNQEDFEKKQFFGRWKKEYEMPKNFDSKFLRYPNPVSPLYSLASPNYGASIVNLHGVHFLAMEAPTEKNLETFFDILNKYKITDLVRLTPKVYMNREGTFPYWEGLMNINSISGMPTIEIANREINYFPLDCWKDHEGIEPKKLLALVKAVKNSEISDPKMVAVHCRAGVGRTGTFIVAYVLVSDIDEQIAKGIKAKDIKISIDKIIWELSLQRPFGVTHFPQYVSLYKLVNYYVDLLNQKQNLN